MISLGKYSFGTGDRFGKQGEAQLKAIMKARETGVEITPVWNKSHREHITVNSTPLSVRVEADAAVKSLNYTGNHFVDADHITLEIVERYIPVSNFFTIDVAQYIGKSSEIGEKNKFLEFINKFHQKFNVPGISRDFDISTANLNQIIDSFLFASEKASEVYHYIKENKKDDFVVEISMDEVKNPQTPEELFFVLAAMAFYKIPINTIAPKFSGRFNKGIDYQGDLNKFSIEFEEDLLVLDFAKSQFELPQDLKFSIHSGSDKFSIYPIIGRLIKKHDAGLHVKTAGTTWLEEINIIAESGEDGFEFALFVYEQAFARFDEITEPYPDVLEIDKGLLPGVSQLKNSGRIKFGKVLRNNPEDSDFNPHFRQLMHCAYKIAAENRSDFDSLLGKYRQNIERGIIENIFDKHLYKIFPIS